MPRLYAQCAIEEPGLLCYDAAVARLSPGSPPAEPGRPIWGTEVKKLVRPKRSCSSLYGKFLLANDMGNGYTENAGDRQESVAGLLEETARFPRSPGGLVR